jgi:hypothetical protein
VVNASPNEMQYVLRRHPEDNPVEYRSAASPYLAFVIECGTGALDATLPAAGWRSILTDQ